MSEETDAVVVVVSEETGMISYAYKGELVRGLSVEVQEKLERIRPETVGQAARISGGTPAAISLLLVHLRRGPVQAKNAA